MENNLHMIIRPFEGISGYLRFFFGSSRLCAGGFKVLSENGNPRLGE